MKLLILLVTIFASVTCLNSAFGDAQYRSIAEQVRYCVVVAEVRIESIRLQRAPNDKFEDLFCECTVLQGFKLPIATNKLTLNFAAIPRSDYEHKTAVLFAFEHESGGFTPWGGKVGLVLTNQVYVEYVEGITKTRTRKEFKYDELIQEIKKITEANKRGAAAAEIQPAELATEGEFYRQFLALVGTNQLSYRSITSPVLVDTNNTSIKITNAVLNLPSLNESGKVSGVRLGMTMEEVVSCWGKPRGAHPRCLHGLNTFFYQDVNLGFESNRLESVLLRPICRFGQGLLSTSAEDDFIRVLGEPSSRHTSNSFSHLVYTSPGASVGLMFFDKELVSVSLERSAKRAEPWK